MAVINKLENTASVTYNGTAISSDPVSTVLLLPPVVTKSVDQVTANIGDTLTYTVTVANTGLNAVTDLAFTDTLPAGASYVVDSFQVDGTAQTPTTTDNTLTYTIPSVAATGETTIQFQATVVGGDR